MMIKKRVIKNRSKKRKSKEPWFVKINLSKLSKLPKKQKKIRKTHNRLKFKSKENKKLLAKNRDK